MRLSILGDNFRLTDPIVQHVEGRLQLALGAASNSINSVCVRLTDVNASRGGLDMRCRIVVRLRNLHVVVAEAIDADLYAAIDAAARRARDAVRKFRRRRRTLRRQFAHRAADRLLV